ncbi:UDP-N-acetylmuramoyl-tripeptide--D-alanyl-D-alanine ligase [Celeribacter halophilus]|uniref:UDP-N-acetylmuramoyl-tripeptide--D-alanyl-D-alanine ligase n=1 Tax=Celeribacter halophilus TaxID=576117 RepID=A0A1I3WWD3_9RHOB|nr:UDP-N-acetylmuramoyl-tripeptide--D-alanyl-D-alanine ligase [Celeribacter halophilus]PZX04743.1 UDP-N-acetylmuramoyl-tripeptide--D-alanyl-D-alanine ligase [Celeribacter halophilus]SFK11792.1 UDP-N-acetylmuramoyl-tripeptide--D-alanyl-D-alanine ligase [Celeribacter halophilus]
MALWTSEAAAQATGGRATQAFEINGVSIDTRTIRPGDLFVALKDVRDGHDFVAQALEKGAAAALVSRIPEGVPEGAPLLVVEDVLPALERLGAAARERVKGKVIGVTGSVGKTSTKEMLRAILSRQGKTHAAEASYNNHWGVPLTLARMPQDTEFAVIEIGMNHPGEIAPLARLARPDVAMITTVAPAHMAAFESLAGIAREKADIFKGLTETGVAVFNGDLDVSDLLAQAWDGEMLRFGEDEANSARLLSVELEDGRTRGEAMIDTEHYDFALSTAGRHFAANAVGCLAVVYALGADVAQAAADLTLWAPPEGRGARETVTLPVGAPVELIDDAFNANPTSMSAALEVLAKAEPQGTGRRIAILGDMLELGEKETAIHGGLAALPWFAALDAVHCVGPLMRSLYDVLPEDRRGTWFETAQEARPVLSSLVGPGDVVLVKGSKGSKVSLLVDEIRKLGQAHPA